MNTIKTKWTVYTTLNGGVQKHLSYWWNGKWVLSDYSIDTYKHHVIRFVLYKRSSKYEKRNAVGVYPTEKYAEEKLLERLSSDLKSLKVSLLTPPPYMSRAKIKEYLSLYARYYAIKHKTKLSFKISKDNEITIVNSGRKINLDSIIAELESLKTGDGNHGEK